MWAVFFAAVGAINQVLGLNGIVCSAAVTSPL
jgi:hypothetical protein